MGRRMTVSHRGLPRAGWLLAGLLASLVARADVLPPLNDPASAVRLPGKFVWIDLVSPDLAAARRFYGGLLGWSFADLGGGQGPYAVAYLDGAPVAGIAERPVDARGQRPPSRWVAYLSVDDVAASARLVAAKGGTVLIPARSLADRGEMALLADPDGAPFGIIRSSSGDPADALADPGGWIWAVYQSPAAARAAAFYQDVGGYEVVADDRLPGVPDYLLVAQGFARASLVEIPAERAGLRPAWIYFLRVADVAATVARARDLGGSVLVAPRPDLAQGRLAVLRDPAGAAFGVLEWNPAGEGN